MMKIVVTGSEGFIGKALCKRLGKAHAEVIGIDRKTGGEADAIGELLKGASVDLVYHLAAQTSVFNDDVEQIRKDNIDTFIKVCDACSMYNVRLVYASSSTANECNMTSMYGLSKRFDEKYASIYNSDAVGVRFHNVYGKDAREGTLLHHLLHDKEVRLYNMGRNMRHFTYIDDIVEGLLYAPGSSRNLINIANPEESSVLDFAMEVSRFNWVRLDLVEEVRKLDKKAQQVNQSIFTVPLDYIPVKEGIKRVFG